MLGLNGPEGLRIPEGIHHDYSKKFKKICLQQICPTRRPCSVSIFSAVLGEMEAEWPCAAGAGGRLSGPLFAMHRGCEVWCESGNPGACCSCLRILMQPPGKWGTEPATWPFPASVSAVSCQVERPVRISEDFSVNTKVLMGRPLPLLLFHLTVSFTSLLITACPTTSGS